MRKVYEGEIEGKYSIAIAFECSYYVGLFQSCQTLILYVYVKNKCFFISKKQNILSNERK